MPEKPWWRQLDGRPPVPEGWAEHPWLGGAVAGLIGWVFVTLLQLAFPGDLGGLGWLFAVLTIPWVIAVAVGLRQVRSGR